VLALLCRKREEVRMVGVSNKISSFTFQNASCLVLVGGTAPAGEHGVYTKCKCKATEKTERTSRDRQDYF